jgi:hypothetical protein
VKDPIQRGGTWWQERDDGTWLRWDEGSRTWQESASPPPPPDDAGLPPVPPMPGQPAAPYGRPAMGGTPPPNYLVWAILVTLFCFLPTGIVAIVFSSQVGTKWAAGDAAGALDSSNKARTWCIVSAVVGVLVSVIVFGIAASSSTSTSFDFS